MENIHWEYSKVTDMSEFEVSKKGTNQSKKSTSHANMEKNMTFLIIDWPIGA